MRTEAEREPLLSACSEAGSTSGPEVCLHQLFEAQAARIPDRPALVAPDGRLTYRELNERADRLANRLWVLGLGPEILTGVLMDRTADLIVTLLAVLKAGGAYVPLDPSYPTQRVLLMLETSRANLLVTRRRLAEALGGGLPPGLRTVFLDPGWEKEPVAEREPWKRSSMPDNLAYVIFTSGSTGVPKGVAIEHRSAVAMIRWAREMYSPEEYAGVLASTSICFDMSVFEIFATLAEGGKIILAENALALPRLEAKDEVTLVDTVPSAMAEVLRLGGLPASIRTVNLGGEALKGSLVREIYDKLSGVERVVNLYGPSEDTTFSTWAVVPPGAERPLIGRPLTGKSAYVLDADLRPVTAGIPGALYLGGEGVTRGYLHRPEATAERYIPNPYGAPGSRLYRVGDLVRVLTTGELDFLGRLDHQVKVRGFRVELGEVESALARHRQVREAAVLALPEPGGAGNRLLAYVETDGASPDLTRELRAFLKQSLPDYMVPSAFVRLDKLPLTPNGKIDRRALASLPPPAESAAAEGARLPRGHAEDVLAEIWSEIFGRAAGIDDDFFDLGGHSLLAARVVARVRETLGLDLPPSAVLEASTLAALAERVEKGLAEKGAVPPPLPPIVPRMRHPDGEPLSAVQRRLWFLERLIPGTTASNIPIVMSLHGPLAPAVLERSLEEIAARHEVLRTTIEIGPDGEPRQLVVPPSLFCLPFVDLSALPLSRRREERKRRAWEEARRPFGPGAGTLWRSLLLRAGERDHDLLVTLHHVVSDGESVQVFEGELAALYSAFLRGVPSPLPALELQATDVAAWERDLLAAGALEPHLAWFRERLAGIPTGLDLPADLPRPPVRSWRGVSRYLALPPELCRAIRGLARLRGATAYMVLLASWVAFLRRVTGQDDFVVGTVLGHRVRPGLAGLIGYFAHDLPLRVERSGDPAFGSLLEEVRTEALGLQAHQDLPLEPLAELLRPERAASADPPFQAFFAFHGNSGGVELAPGLTAVWREEDHGAAQFDLLLDLEERGEEIAGRVAASADLFTPATAERWMRGWAALLADAVARPEAPVSDLALLGAVERHALLVEWGSAVRPPVWDRSVPARVAAWAAATPGAVAVLPAEPGLPALTYGELVARAHRFAGQLRTRGVGPDVRVGVYAERSPETVVGMLAVLLAGGAFLPLDPAYPAERLALVLDDACVPLLLARRGLAAALPAGDAELVPLDGTVEPAPTSEVPEDAGPEDLAYIIYTSGSTGKPKGVLIPHRGFLWAVEALAQRSGLGPESRVLQFASAGFDASVWEIWSALISGATLVFARAEDLLPGPSLLATLRRRGITNVFLTPSALAAMPDGASAGLADLRGLVVGGEAFPPDLVARWAPGRRLWNAYGPTEVSICATMARLGEDGQTPIGRPVADNRLLVLGPHLELLPRGVPGELYLGGGGLARGYLGRSDLTAAAFVPDPFSGEKGERLYRTGDLVRFRPDGQLEFLGRADRQVKVRGFRIEPGEVEAQIAEHPGVREAAVVPYEAAPRDLRLAAYVVAAAAAPSAQELRAFLRARLPEHMVPSSFSFLGALPLSPGGKVDRRALPSPVPDETAPPGGPAALGTPTEELLAGIWGEVLGREQVGAADDFFDLGGHSLLIGQVLARVRAAFGVDLPVRSAFEARTLAALARRIEGERHAARGPEPPPLARIPRDRPLPLSFGQERLWFLHRLEPGSPAYNLPVTFHLQGSLDVSALARAVAGIAERHEVLRTTYADAEGEAVQIIHPPLPPPLPLLDLTGLPAARRLAEADLVAAEEARRPFDLVRGPVLRPLLLRLDERQHRLLTFCHHAAFDGWSVGVLRRELGALYGAFAAGRPSPLAEPAVQYADFAAWQRAWLRGEDLEKLLARWADRLAGAPTALELPADRPRPPVRSDRGGVRTVSLPAARVGAVRDLGRREGATPFMILLAALAALLGRSTGQRDFLVGTPIAGRNRAELESLIGFFVNTLVLRCAPSAGDLSFRELLARLREECLAAYGVQDLPLEKLVERLQPERDPSRNPLFQVLFVLQTAPARGVQEPEGLSLEAIEVETGTSKFDLTLEAVPAGEALRLRFEYSADLFDAATIERLAGHFHRLLEGAVARPGERLGDLAILSRAARQQVLREWNDSGRGYGSPGCLHQLVEAQVDRTPDAVAVVCDGRSLSYGELDRRANRLAHRLLHLGVRPESPVGICAERSLELEVGLLAILKAGGAYLPLDPEYPRERLAFMVEDALGGLAAPVLLTQGRLLPVVPETGARVVLLEEAAGEGEPCPRPEVPVHLDQVAYLIYTSGSTGRPKGVMSSHRGIVNRLLWMQETYRLDATDRVLQKTPASFDVSVWEFFWPLLAGARLVMALPGGHRDPSYLAGTIAAEGVTTAHFVPSMLSLFLEAPEAAGCTGLRRVVCSGEALSYELQQRFHSRLACPLHNLYGPTEAAVDVTYWACRRGGAPVVPIGRPVANTRIHLLDSALRPVPVGVAGELHIGGVQLARGYWGRAELTAERFVPDAQAEDAGSRLYKTGDLARYRPDGGIEYLGRLDDQVKVRGVRVELGEIEAVLAEHPEVREAVVAARQDGGDTRLVAWVVPSTGAAPDRRGLRAFLAARLPEPMVPAAWVFLPAMPLTPSGKVNRRALPEPAEELRGNADSFVAPRTPVEEVVAGIWSAVLGVETVGATDHFFALGGHSLLAARVVSRLRDAFGVEIPLRRLFEAPTVAALAAVVEASRRSPSAVAEAPPIVPVPRTGAPPLSFSQQRLWLLDRLDPGSPVYNLALPYLVRGRLVPAVLERALSEVVRRHEVLRTTFEMAAGSGEPRPIVASPGAFSVPCVDLAGLPAAARTAEAERLANEDAARPFDLATGPLFRATLLVTGGAERRLLMTMHHIAGDGWSLGVLLGELSALYRAFAAGLPTPLPELAIQYADFAAWQRRWLAGSYLEAQLAYWRRQLAGAPEALDLPTDRPRPAAETSRGALFSAPLPSALAAGVRALSRRQGATLFMVLLSGFAALLRRLTGATDLLLGSPIAGRGRTEIEGLIGFFVNTLVLRADLAGDPSFGTLIARVREMALAAYAHQDLPFERLVEELQPQRSLARSPLFQVAFVLGVEEPVQELAPGLPLSRLSVETRTSRFDLTLAIDVRGDALIAQCEHRTDLFDRTTVARWVGHFAHLLGAAAASPDAPLSSVGLLSAAERHQVSGEWNDTGAALAPEVCLHQLFEAQAGRTPEAVALVSPDGRQRLAYRELDRRAESLARRLRGLGVGPEALAGVLVDRRVELVVALLAVLKAGGAYVPIDPAYPRQRVALLLQSSRAAVLLTRRSLLAEFADSLPRATVPVFLDEGEGGEAGGVSEAPAARTPLSSNLAYIIYTSGSTGEPKGVAIEHRSAVAFARWAREVFSPAEMTGVLGSTSICFDISIMEIFVTLAWGGKILLAENALALPALPARDEVTMINAVPSAIAELVRSGRLPDSVRTVNVGGEAVKGSLARRIYEQSRAERVIDVYGPSEDTTYSTTSHIPRDVEIPAVGRPITGSRAYILDAELRPVPIGVPGAVYLAGDGLARGYLRRPDLTAERFIPDPHGEPGSRLYRVGDLARWRAAGEMECLGRIDHQVKVRGFRIELGEIEAALAGHPCVRQAAVAAREVDEDNRLTAYVELQRPADAAELRAWLQAKLPAYMVPAVFVILEALPLLPNGKVDRRALPAEDLASQPASAAPRNLLEEVAAGIVAAVLGVERVGIEDDFFALGGHSLLATRLAARLREVLGTDLPMRQIFETPTVAGLAAEIEKSLRAPGAPPLPPIEPAAAGDEAPASSAQERLWYFHQLDPGGAVLNIPHPLRLAGSLRPAALARSLAEIARRHASLRTTFAYGEGGLRQRIAPSGEVALPLADLGGLPPPRREEEARRLTGEAVREPFDLAAGPLWRARLVRLGREEHWLLAAFHHIIADGWSADLFDRELAALYPAHAAGIASPLPEPALQYADFAVWQRRWLTDEALAPQLAYWRRQLAGMPPALELPADRPRPARQSFRGASRSLPLPPDLSVKVKELGRGEGTTFFMTVLAAFAALIGRYTGRTDVVLGSPAANRHRPGSEGLFGFFAGNLVLRLDLSGDPAFRELLHRAREAALGAYAHPDVPFERLMEELGVARDKSRNSLVQVMLLTLSGAAEPLRFAGLAVEPVPAHTATSQFDLTVAATDGSESLTLEAEYSTDLFDGETVDRMLAHLSLLLAAVAADPELRLSALPAAIAPCPRRAAPARPASETSEVEKGPDPEDREARIAERRARLSAEQKSLLEQRLRARSPRAESGKP